MIASFDEGFGTEVATVKAKEKRRKKDSVYF
jgi:hypothetical protein